MAINQLCRAACSFPCLLCLVFSASALKTTPSRLNLTVHTRTDIHRETFRHTTPHDRALDFASSLISRYSKSGSIRRRQLRRLFRDIGLTLSRTPFPSGRHTDRPQTDGHRKTIRKREKGTKNLKRLGHESGVQGKGALERPSGKKCYDVSELLRIHNLMHKKRLNSQDILYLTPAIVYQLTEGCGHQDNTGTANSQHKNSTIRRDENHKHVLPDQTKDHVDQKHDPSNFIHHSSDHEHGNDKHKLSPVNHEHDNKHEHEYHREHKHKHEHKHDNDQRHEHDRKHDSGQDERSDNDHGYESDHYEREHKHAPPEHDLRNEKSDHQNYTKETRYEQDIHEHIPKQKHEKDSDPDHLHIHEHELDRPEHGHDSQHHLSIHDDHHGEAHHHWNAIHNHFSQIPLRVWGLSVLAVVVISLVGLVSVAIIPFMTRVFYHTFIHFLVALAIGSLVGDALLHLIPHALSGDSHSDKDMMNGHDGNHSSSHNNHHSSHSNAVWKGMFCLAGIICFFVMERLLTIRSEEKVRKKAQTKPIIMSTPQPSVTDLQVGIKLSAHEDPDYHVSEDMVTNKNTSTKQGDQAHTLGVHAHSHFADVLPQSVAAIAWMVIVGDGIHNFSDGLALGAAFSNSIPGGISTSIAIFCHELPHEIGDFAMLLQAGMTVRQALVYNCVSSVLCFVGMVIGVAIGNIADVSLWIFAVVAGMFIYLALIDMFPELVKNKPADGRNGFCRLLFHLLGICVGVTIMTLIAVYEEEMLHIVDF